MPASGTGTDRAVGDGFATPGLWQQDAQGLALGMFKRDLDGVASMVREADIGDDSGSAYCVLPRDDLRDAGSNQ